MDKNGENKSRDQIKAERDSRKAAKLALKNKAKDKKNEPQKNIVNSDTNIDHVSQSSAEDTKPSLRNKSAENVSKKIESDLRSFENPENVPEKTDTNEMTKSKSQLRAERREKQEAQRALKANGISKVIKEQSKGTTKEKPKGENYKLQLAPAKEEVKGNSKPKTGIKVTFNVHRVKLLNHLYHSPSIEEAKITAVCTADIHPAVIKLGSQYRNKTIIGSNARCAALLHTVKQVITDYVSPAEKDYSRGLESKLTALSSYIQNCRPFSVSMTNAMKHLKWHLTLLPNNITDHEAQCKLNDAIDSFIKEQIEMAGKAIGIMVQRKISDGDVILTYGYSSLIERILIGGCRSNQQFRVIVVDSAPLFEGKELCRRLVKRGINCTYVLLTATSYIMKEATKVLLGAHALLTNGYVMSRAGSSQVALIANAYNVPVLVCCETYKFSERVQTDAFVYNELGDPGTVMKDELWQSNGYLTPLTLMYDVTEPDLVTAVVTELAILPCTSVPVVLRVKPTESPVS